jgi:hypothetical protein
LIFSTYYGGSDDDACFSVKVDGNQNEPYLFISCGDDETVKIWGVKDKIKI